MVAAMLWIAAELGFVTAKALGACRLMVCLNIVLNGHLEEIQMAYIDAKRLA